MTLAIGTAGWSIARDCAAEFPAEGSSLSRYSAQFNAAEINSSFHRPHRLSTWHRWAESVPATFRFSVKVPKLITHEQRLVGSESLIERFLSETDALGGKLAVLLVQLPPKLAFDRSVAGSFFSTLTKRTPVKIACEPRHPSWFDLEAEALFDRFQVARVAADPPICDAGSRPGGWQGLRYWRLHGSPIVYRSSYRDRLQSYAPQLREELQLDREVWCIFDNTASSAATDDALALLRMMNAGRRA